MVNIGVSSEVIAAREGEANLDTRLDNQRTIVQRSDSYVNTSTTQTSIIPIDNTKPQVGEGTQVLSLSHTPLNASNVLYIDVLVHALTNAGGSNVFTVALFDGIADPDSVAVGSQLFTQNTKLFQTILSHKQTAGGTSAISFTVRAGPNANIGWDFNGALYNGLLFSWIRILEFSP